MTDTEVSTVFSIRDTNARIRAIIEKETVGKSFWITGLARRLYHSDFGHLYFELFDVEDQYAIQCMLRENVRDRLGFSLANGQMVEVLGTVRVFEQRAKIELEVEAIRLIESVLPRINEDAEAILCKKDLWPRAKRPLPETISRIWLVSSRNSDAVRDFETHYREHGGQATFKHKYVRIQGPHAAQEIADAINAVNRDHNGDPSNVIVLTRGGGRDADLEVFSDPIVGEGICRSVLPVLTGIGHEANETFADIAADVSKGTPTAIAVFLATHEQTKRLANEARKFEQFTSNDETPAISAKDSTFKERLELFALIAAGIVIVVILMIALTSQL